MSNRALMRNEMRSGYCDSTSPAKPLEMPHAATTEDVVAAFQTAVATGLSSDAVALRQAKYGRNQLAARSPQSIAHLIRHQFESPVVLLLTAAAVIAMAFGEWTEGVAICLVLLINGIIGFFTELRAARSMEALRVLGNLTTRVRREGHTALVPAEDLVPGDVVLLEGGDVVTADLRLIQASNLSADEAALTGESVPVEKGTVDVAPDCPIGDRTGMAFKGTAITRGSAIGIVVATGLQSELGQISRLVEEAAPAHSPLERQLQRLSGQLIKFTVAFVAVLGVLGVVQGGGCPVDDRGLDRPRGRCNPRGFAHRGDDGAGAWHVADGQTQRADRAVVCG